MGVMARWVTNAGGGSWQLRVALQCSHVMPLQGSLRLVPLKCTLWSKFLHCTESWLSRHLSLSVFDFSEVTLCSGRLQA